MRYFLINAFGEDKPGIVAKVSEVLYKLGFNLENSSMSRLGGEFTIMLVVATEKDIDVRSIEDSFKPVEKELNLSIHIKEIPYEEYKNQKQEQKHIYRVIIYGADKPGIVYKFAKILADKSINIIDMTTEKTGDLYILLTEINLPDNINFETLKEDIEKLKEELNIDASCEKVEVIQL